MPPGPKIIGKKISCSTQMIMKFRLLLSIKIKKFTFLHAQISLEFYVFLLINVKMSTAVGILTFTSRKNFMLS